jgi:hypothetical protein
MIAGAMSSIYPANNYLGYDVNYMILIPTILIGSIIL